MRTCTVCGFTGGDDDFKSKGRRSDGTHRRANVCRRCDGQRRLRHRDPEKHRRESAERYRRHRDAFIGPPTWHQLVCRGWAKRPASTKRKKNKGKTALQWQRLNRRSIDELRPRYLRKLLKKRGLPTTAEFVSVQRIQVLIHRELERITHEQNY